MFNVANGIIWQLALMAAPICLVVRKWDTFWWTTGVVVVTSLIMKIAWHDRLETGEVDATDAKTPPVEA